MKNAVLFLVFNRPENTARTFERIRAARPPRLWIHADGPRVDRLGEAEKCAATRAIFDQIDWPCAVTRLFRIENWGLKKGISDALDRFFEAEKAGIILEDDCLADPSFFTFCDAMLEKYADDDRVMNVAGHNWNEKDWPEAEADYLFSRYSIISAWATWARAWKKRDLEMADLEAFEKSETWSKFLPSRIARAYLIEKFRAVRAEKINSWAFGWFFSVARAGGLGIVARKNLVENIGINQADATNTNSKTDPRTARAENLNAPFRSPKSQEPNAAFDMTLFYTIHKSRNRLILRSVLQFFNVAK